MTQFEEQLHQDLHQFLQSMTEIDARLPECPDVEEKWEQIAKAYIPDGIREFNDFPSASLGWMMYIGMAVAKFWDAEWEIYSKIDDLYAYMRDKRGYDSMDEYIREDVLLLRGVDYTVLEKLVGECIMPYVTRTSSREQKRLSMHTFPVCINSTCLEPLCSSSTSEAAKPSGTGWAIT